MEAIADPTDSAALSPASSVDSKRAEPFGQDQYFESSCSKRSYIHVSFDAQELEVYNQVIKNVP